MELLDILKSQETEDKEKHASVVAIKSVPDKDDSFKYTDFGKIVVL